MNLPEACRFKGGSDATSWELMPKVHSKLTHLAEPQGRKHESYTAPVLLPRLLAVPRRGHDPIGVDKQYIERSKV